MRRKKRQEKPDIIKEYAVIYTLYGTKKDIKQLTFVFCYDIDEAYQKAFDELKFYVDNCTGIIGFSIDTIKMIYEVK